MKPVKRINEQADMATFERSPARKRLGFVIESLAQAVAGYEVPGPAYIVQDATARNVVERIAAASSLVDEIKPVETPQRFGNPSYREWLARTGARLESGNDELDHYLKNAFGSAQRIDFGTGHELNFIAYWDGLLRLGGSPKISGTDVLFVFYRYFELCRKVIKTYNLEPAGSHGVWGLDDHFHLPFILGAAQLSQQGPSDSPVPKEVSDRRVVEQYKDQNLYFGAIDFIYQVKTGAFFEHSPMLFDISGVKTWSKIKGGMIKMYNGEVLSKFPVVQHFYFGELFAFEG